MQKSLSGFSFGKYYMSADFEDNMAMPVSHNSHSTKQE